MKTTEQRALPPQLDRFELKYTIPFHMVEPISDFASLYCSLDNYSLKSENRFYRVNNLYLDSPNYLFLKKRIEGAETRFNMRVRSYGDKPELPYFLEIKQKSGDIVRKYREKTDDKDWYKSYGVVEELHGAANEKQDLIVSNKKLFERIIYTYNVSPKIFTQYMRKAYISDIDDYARVTFDINLRYMERTEYNLIPDENLMASYDHSEIFEPDSSVILELKCYTSKVPLWMIDLIKYFDLKRTSFSKYMNGAFELMNLDRFHSGERVPTQFFKGGEYA